MKRPTGIKMNAGRVGPCRISATLPPICFLVVAQAQSVISHASVLIALGNPFWTDGAAHAESSASVARCIVFQIRISGRGVCVSTIGQVAICPARLRHP